MLPMNVEFKNVLSVSINKQENKLKENLIKMNNNNNASSKKNPDNLKLLSLLRQLGVNRN